MLIVKIVFILFNNVDRYIECNSTEKSNGDKYLIFAFTDKNKDVLEKYTEPRDEIKNQIEAINGGEPIKHKKDFMKSRFKSYDDLSLGKILSIPGMIIVARSVLQEDSKYYSQVYLHECLYKFENEL